MPARVSVAAGASCPACDARRRDAREKGSCQLSKTIRKAGRLTWNGEINRKLVPRGVYKIIVQAVSPSGVAAYDAGALPIS